MRAEVGDQLVGPGPTIAHGEVLGVVIEVHGCGGSPPYTIRWYDGGEASVTSPDPEHYWIRSHRDTLEVGTANGTMHRVA